MLICEQVTPGQRPRSSCHYLMLQSFQYLGSSSTARHAVDSGSFVCPAGVALRVVSRQKKPLAKAYLKKQFRSEEKTYILNPAELSFNAIVQTMTSKA